MTASVNMYGVRTFVQHIYIYIWINILYTLTKTIDILLYDFGIILPAKIFPEKFIM